MESKTARLLNTENGTEISKKSHAEFLFEYQKSILLTLSEQGVINAVQCQQCLERLVKEQIPSVHS